MVDVLESIDAAALRRWAYRCVDSLTARCDEIDALNVFPIPDSDTGTNLMFTFRAAVESMRAAGPTADARAIGRALAVGAVAGARGNSGVIVSQLLRAVAEASADGPLDTVSIQAMLRRAKVLVAAAVSVPVEGTMLTVLDAADREASAHEANVGLSTLVVDIAEATARAVDSTTDQLAELREAGVVDAGALGLSVIMDALVEVVIGRTPPRRRYRRPHEHERRAVSGASNVSSECGGAPESVSGHGSSRPLGYEVVYVVHGPNDARAAELRRDLADIGDSVVVAGDGSGAWSAHVHTTDPGSAVDLGIAAGDVRGVRISCFGFAEFDGAVSPRAHDGAALSVGRDILALVAGEGAADLYVQEGATVVRCDEAIDSSVLHRAIVGMKHREVLVLPNGALSAQELVAVGAAARADGKDVVMLPCSAMVQGLAALAVHDAARAAVDDAFTMSEAAAGTRWGSLRIARERSLTWVGTCEPGDCIGLAGQEVVIVAARPLDAGCRLIDQLLATGGEMVTVLVGAEASEDFGDQLAEYVAGAHPGVDVVVYTGGQPGDLVQFGVE
ncbi:MULTISPECIES: DAK2 domain-containing protein [unclassified Rhodococcus (in: high G+C Gram-positive bacteria)]|uniref:DAK2 domain-containing protein n=1 Tax=unclassified Rhodococcus (in: high G+C Gram-positive bacteria) TaxID=192944 RepID=UPI0029558611|nr:DAK2 domain-containing protein [Rhodococcus sp. IEGM 1343]MDV8055230.1 DAK2 domain-containing protein [Rhodococcus sp. IEGM 1343]